MVHTCMYTRTRMYILTAKQRTVPSGLMAAATFTPFFFTHCSLLQYDISSTVNCKCARNHLTLSAVGFVHDCYSKYIEMHCKRAIASHITSDLAPDMFPLKLKDSCKHKTNQEHKLSIQHHEPANKQFYQCTVHTCSTQAYTYVRICCQIL